MIRSPRSAPGPASRSRSQWPIVVAVVTVAILATPGLPAADLWQTEGGVTSIRFNLETLSRLGLEISTVDETASPSRRGFWGFRIDPESRLSFEATAGSFDALLAGRLSHRGGLVLTSGRESISLLDFELHVAGGGFELRGDGDRWFDVGNMQVHLVPERRSLQLVNLDLFLSTELAERILRPELAGLYVGSLDLSLPMRRSDRSPAVGECDDLSHLPVDVQLTEIDSLSQVAREPGVRVALSLAASLINLGPGTIPWFRSIEPDGPPEDVGEHPFLVMHLYRSMDGVLRQIGRSDVKHAFFATNSGCACPSGHLLYAGCGDLYGVSTNEDRRWLAPRSEILAATADWTSLGSHFDAVPVDDFRDHHGNSEHDGFEHRLVVPEGELAASPAEFFIEAWYVAKDDVDIYTAMGHREVTPTLSGGIWTFSFDTALELGSILDTWVDPANPDVATRSSKLRGNHENLHLAASSAAVADGLVRYEYALANFDSDVSVTSFHVPLPNGAQPVNIGFDDVDTDPGNDWQAVVEAEGLRWTAPPGGGLEWGTLYNFRFELDAAPGIARARLDFEGGGGLNVSTTAPDGPSGGPTVAFSGTCPNGATLDASGLTPLGKIVVVVGDAPGSDPVPLGVCRANVTGISTPAPEITATADSGGALAFSGSLPSRLCGSTLQVLDVTTCALSGPVQIPD